MKILGMVSMIQLYYQPTHLRLEKVVLGIASCRWDSSVRYSYSYIVDYPAGLLGGSLDVVITQPSGSDGDVVVKGCTDRQAFRNFVRHPRWRILARHVIIPSRHVANKITATQRRPLYSQTCTATPLCVAHVRPFGKACCVGFECSREVACDFAGENCMFPRW